MLQPDANLTTATRQSHGAVRTVLAPQTNKQMPWSEQLGSESDNLGIGLHLQPATTAAR